MVIITGGGALTGGGGVAGGGLVGGGGGITSCVVGGAETGRFGLARPTGRNSTRGTLLFSIADDT